MKLRDYQQETKEKTYDYWGAKNGSSPLAVVPTGGGKTPIYNSMIGDMLAHSDARVLMLTHDKNLISQGAQSLMRFNPDFESEVGIYSAGLKSKSLKGRALFAGIQSIYQRAYDMDRVDVCFIDEAHLVPRNENTRYGKFISDLKVCNSHIKFCGLTATDYRLDSGRLHQGEGALFDGIAHEVSVSYLMDEGYLTTLQAKGGGANNIDLNGVKKRGGEYILADLAIAASDPELVYATVKDIVEQGQSQSRWLVFSSGIEHGVALRDQFRAHGVSSEMVSSKHSDSDEHLEAHKRGEFKCLVNVDKLTTGYDDPRIDLIALVRSTMSPGLMVQMLGRGTRLYDGDWGQLPTAGDRLEAIANSPKPFCQVLDYGHNIETHGFLDQIKPPAKSGGSGDGEAPSKECPSCQHIVPAGCRNCPECDHEFPPPQLNHGHKSYSGALLSSQVQNEWLDVNDVIYQKWSKQGKPDSVRVTYDCGLTKVSEWLCPDHGGFAASRYHARMPALKADAKTTADALNECHMWVKPSRICVRPDGKWHQIVQLDYTQKEKPIDDTPRYESWDEIPF